MPIDARSISVKPLDPVPPLDVTVHVQAIDRLLEKPWSPHELRDDPPDDYAGRSYEITKLSWEEEKQIVFLFEAAGWRIVRHGAHGQNAYTPREEARTFLRFVPPIAGPRAGGG